MREKEKDKKHGKHKRKNENTGRGLRRKTTSQNHQQGEKERVTIPPVFDKQQNPDPEVSEVCDIAS